MHLIISWARTLAGRAMSTNIVSGLERLSEPLARLSRLTRTGLAESVAEFTSPHWALPVNLPALSSHFFFVCNESTSFVASFRSRPPNFAFQGIDRVGADTDLPRHLRRGQVSPPRPRLHSLAGR